MNVLDLFNLSLIGRKEKTCLVFKNKEFTFGELDLRSNRTAALLQSKGVMAGDRVCLYLENNVEFIDLYLACLKLGAIAVPINILYREREINHILNDATPKIVIAKTAIPGTPTLPIDTIKEEISRFDSSFAPTLTTGDSPAAIVYTSGTTGASKGAVLSHNNFIANAINLNTCWKITDNDRLLLGLPLFHVHGLANGLHCALIAGAHIKLLERLEHQKLVDEFKAYRPTMFYGVPTVYVRLLEQSAEAALAMSASIRLFVSGSAPLPAQVLEGFKERYGQVILERYGMTETLMNTSNPYIGERRAGTVGFPLPGVSVKIIGADGCAAAPGEEGELYVKGPNVFGGYWNRDEATQAAFDNGYFKTGDMAVCSTDGYIILRGRKSDLIISGGFNIYPREIEEFLMEQESISEAAVVGVPDRLRGELPVAYIVPNGNIDVKLLEQKCRKELASFKIPHQFFLLDKLPRTALGKVQKHLLTKTVN